ncbi:MAG TPA: SDR family NAD(P)-dependent oxidoreductase [Nevskia sp.]|nr:SDR family NAD(P)-dependent oxidoreductase [Nevskia sp.]
MSQVCLVVGAGPGIGSAVAMAFAREGYGVALAARNPARLQPYCEEIRRATGRAARAYAADGADAASLHRLFETVTAELGAPEVVIYNVASSHKGRPTTVTPERWLEDYRSNVLGALVCAQLAAGTMREQGHGSILFTGGGFAHEPSAPYASLSADKAALRNLAYSLAQELGAYGIHVATVTVYGFLQVGTHFDPQRIAATYVRLHHQPKGRFETEVVYK